ncbi:Glucosidase 2 subunit beta [Cytospora mali]|uniref:Glucosidase 2 subunit beta n=1 Tax=Cytospora mali TaxID=578113 RepID=A0A194V570_CYTMA|nr:Glucosidase 2 subunit beta [Valsa mali var. pyri (nom. inval.)]
MSDWLKLDQLTVVAKFYSTGDSFTCIGHPSISLKSSQINDNSCDCPDGSDEPGTAACAYLDPLSPAQPLPASSSGTTKITNALPGFWCENAGHIGAYLPFLYVNDGVCDYDICCDGSEEYAHAGGVKCENRCDSIGKEYRKLEAARRQAKEKAAKHRRALAKEARELRRKVEAKITSLEEEIKNLQAKKDDLEKKYHDIEQAERGKVVKTDGEGGKIGVLLGLAKNRVNELRETLNAVLDQRKDLQDRVDELEQILKKFKEEYNPNFNDEGVKTAVKTWEDYAAKIADAQKTELAESDIAEIVKEDGEGSGINWKEFEQDEVTDTDILYSVEAYLPDFMRSYIHQKLSLLRVWLIENGIVADNPSSGHESHLVTAAREAFQAVENDLSKKEKTLREEKEDLDKDYGADDIFRVLKDKCVSTDSGEYTYEVCWLGKTSQKSKKGHAATNMGKFTRVDTEEADDEERLDGKSLGKGPRMVMRYENGQSCWNGPQRRTDVWLGCADSDEIWRVSESEKCVYKMEVGTPAACEDVQEPGVRTKDEL